jgi:hypothetical protein
VGVRLISLVAHACRPVLGPLVFGVALCTGLVLGPTAGARVSPTPITNCSNDSQLRAAASAGGSYAFACDGDIAMTDDALTVTKDLSIAAAGHKVILHGPGNASQIIDFRDGTARLAGLKLTGGYVYGAYGGTGPDGVDYPGAGGDGGDGGNGGPGGPARGGSILVESGASVTLHSVTIANSAVHAGAGGFGGEGGNPSPGGSPGDGGDSGPGGTAQGGAVYVSPGASLTAEDTTFRGGKAETYTTTGGLGGITLINSQWIEGLPGDGGAGGAAEGGAIYNAGTLTIVGGSFDHNVATNRGGIGGTPLGYDEAVLPGDGGNSGAVRGGAIFNIGRLSISGGTTFTGNETHSEGGVGGNVTGHNESRSGDGGNGGDTLGGAIFTTKVLGSACARYSGNGVTSEGGSPGWNSTNGLLGIAGAPGAMAGPNFFGPGSGTACPPDTTITSGPTATTTDRTPTFQFKSSQAGSTFSCSIDGAAFAACSSPKTLPTLAFGNHSFKVRATTGGKTDPTPAQRGFKVVH